MRENALDRAQGGLPDSVSAERSAGSDRASPVCLLLDPPGGKTQTHVVSGPLSRSVPERRREKMQRLVDRCSALAFRQMTDERLGKSLEPARHTRPQPPRAGTQPDILNSPPIRLPQRRVPL